MESAGSTGLRADLGAGPKS